MAIMIPEKPRNFDPASQEGLIFNALALLPEDYYVFHSFRITDTRDGTFRESKTDFVIFNRTKGVICLEAKAGQVRYENGCWLYGSGIPMHNGGPFNQASANKYKLTDIIQLIHDIIVGLDQGGTFYVFYDRLQLIQAKEMPKFIGDLDCRLTLYRNCRNTENIAVTSLRPITERKPKVFEGTVKGAPARIHFCDSVQNERERIDSIIDNLAADGYRDVVLLTCKTEATSILSDSVNNGRYRNKYLFTTCRKFKGLEADVVILLDVDKATFEQENVLIFYVGTSRARIKLEITAILSDDDCKEILTSVLNYQGKIRRAKKDFAGALNAIGCLET